MNKIKVIPQNKFGMIYPSSIDNEQNIIELTEEEHNNIACKKYCFSDDLQKVIPYVKSEADIAFEYKLQLYNDAQCEINALKTELIKAKEDVEQVELFKMERDDYQQKKNKCVEIIKRLRELSRIKI